MCIISKFSYMLLLSDVFGFSISFFFLKLTHWINTNFLMNHFSFNFTIFFTLFEFFTGISMKHWSRPFFCSIFNNNFFNFIITFFNIMFYLLFWRRFYVLFLIHINRFGSHTFFTFLRFYNFFNL